MAFLAAIPAALGIGAAEAGTAAGIAGATTAAGVAEAGATAAGLGLEAGAAAGGLGAAAGAGAGTGLTTALSTIGLVGSAGSTLFGALGSRQTAAAQQAAANYQAQVAANNAIIAQQNARYAAQAGQVNAQAQDFKTRALLGTEMAAQGASGIDLTTGSLSDVRRSTGELGRLDTANIVQSAGLTGYGYNVAATNYAAQAGLERQQAGFAGAAGNIATAGTILGGASQFATKWQQFQDRGALLSGFG